MNAVCPRFGDHVEHAARGSSELDAEIPGLHRHLFHGIGNVERLGHAGQRDIIVLGAVQKIVVAARTLAVNRVFRPGRIPGHAAGRLGHAGQRASQRERAQADQRQLTHLAGQKVPAAQRAVPHRQLFRFSIHSDRGRFAAHLEPDIQGRGAIGLHPEVRGKKGIEPRMLDSGAGMCRGPPRQSGRSRLRCWYRFDAHRSLCA